MAKKFSSSPKKFSSPPAKVSPGKAAVSSPVRNSPLPKAVSPAIRKMELTHDQIARRAYEIHLSGSGGSETDNWLRAERELLGGR